ncbi:MAG TPA: amidase [Burkholderiaceae bacterium]|nr:amidase [Burkholderiaceae bacterium]
MDFRDYRQYDGLGLAQLVARGEVSAAELMETALARADAVEPRLHTLVARMDEAARAAARLPAAGPFGGVPFLVKDLFQECQGEPSWAGSRALHHRAPKATRDSEIVARWRAAGLLVAGRTNLPEFGTKGITEPEAFGPTRNPWNPAHNPGGSSGGSAAAVAAGIVPLAGANDGGGSIRIPAAWCGLFGFKPGRGRTPFGPSCPDAVGGLAVNHVLTRSVRDSAALLDATHGPAASSLVHLAPPVRPYLEEAATDPAPLRIGFATASPIGTEVHSEAVEAVSRTARLLESLGHRVEEAAPALDGMQVARDFLQIWFGQCAVIVDAARRLGAADAEFEFDTRLMAALGRALRASDYAQSQQRCAACMPVLAEFFGRYDVWLTPAVAMPAPRIGEIVTPAHERAATRLMLALGLGRALLESSLVRKLVSDNLRWVPFTQLANLTGLPAMSVPLHWAREGLPIGAQFTAAIGGEGVLFRLAGQLERAQPWFNRLPPEA